ncbi:hypothetical protein E1286_06330 [Nonomuraea terrae]|uniref:Septum formation-related domain-containing protein n=1 Tax=Nonomuraea terrae TaxID=2530383 RepID=A0A4R4Z9Z1_9ACTN|nr:septum formation family protein [Nonomuraea terrae]TDD54114.1 hypothetical protein E1286_06330 [Nonomuraea terrae]
MALDEAAGVALYTHNAFRVTGLSTYADRRAVRQRRQDVLPRIAVGADVDLGHDLPPGDVSAAFDRLQNDPRRRLVEELFWLWDTPDATCSCSHELHRGHDDAVRAHRAALERETAAVRPTGQELQQLWSDAGQRWREVLRRAVFWDHVRQRIAALDDRQLGEADVDALRRDLPAALVKPLIELAAKPGESQARLAAAARAWPMAAVDDLLEDLAAPIYEDTRRALTDAMEELDAGRHERAASIARQRILPQLVRLEALVPHERHRATASMRNQTAILLNNCATALMERLGPAADEPAGSLLDEAAELNSDPVTAQRIKQNRGALKDTAEAFDKIEREARKWEELGRHDLADDYLRRVRRALRSEPWADEAIDRIRARLRAGGGARPSSRPSRPSYAPDRPSYERTRSSYGPRRRPAARGGFFRGLFRLVNALLWVAVPTGLIVLTNHLFGDTAEPSTGALYSESRAYNAPVGSCLETKEGWQTDHSQVLLVDCGEPHWGEVLGYASLGEVPSPYPGEDQVQAMAAFECSRLQARQDLPFEEYRIHYFVPREADWNEGEGRFENYTPCVVSRHDDKPLSGAHVADPPPRPESEAVVPMSVHTAQIKQNPPVGSCVQDQESWGADKRDIPIVDCELPHWAEIVAYPKLFEKSQPWPGEDKVQDAAEAACEASTRVDEGYRFHISPPGKGWWDDKDAEIYAVCLVSQADDSTFSGGLR